MSCVEAGRWRSRSRTFSSAPRTQYSSGRAKRMAQVTASMKTAGLHHSDQSEVWADIAEMSARLKSSSPTGAMAAIFSDHATFIDQCAASMPAVENQVGAIFTIGTRVVGADLFDAPETMRKLLPKLVRAVAVDALDADGAEQSTGAIVHRGVPWRHRCRVGSRSARGGWWPGFEADLSGRDRGGTRRRRQHRPLVSVRGSVRAVAAARSCAWRTSSEVKKRVLLGVSLTPKPIHGSIDAFP